MAMKKYLLIFLLLPGLAFATVKKPTPMPQPPEQNQKQYQKQGQEQQQQQQQTATGGSSSSSNEGVSVGGDTSNVENNSSTVVLVPNNNTENCLRIWGLAFGNSSGTSAGLGYPHRSAACDYEQAADDAGAVGDHNLAWYWRCHKKNILKPFRMKVRGQSRGDRDAAATDACHIKMVKFLDMGTAASRIKLLTEQRDILLRERVVDRERCAESKDRILLGCAK